MSFERWNYLFCLLLIAPISAMLWRIADDPERTRAGRVIVRALDSWFLRTRWSLEPRRRLRVMAIAGGLLALLFLVLLLLDPEPRYAR